ncbi:MAG TPA: IclR family transcriptional regulator, partial [Candidatus Binatus sp.]|nr:IclR family transcriptional regulator [Candidatus Binatus sp.]
GTSYRLGPRLLTLASGVSSTRALVAIAHPSLVELAQELGEAAGLSVPDGRMVQYIDQVDSPNPVMVRDWTGTRSPMHAVSSGLVVLAALTPSALEAYLSGPLERLTERTVTVPSQLRDRLWNVRRDGYAWVRDEFAIGISSVAAAIADASGEVVAAVHVHGPSYRFPPDGRTDAIGQAVEATAGRIGARLRA